MRDYRRCEVCRAGGAKAFDEERARAQFTSGIYATGQARFYCARHKRYDALNRLSAYEGMMTHRVSLKETSNADSDS